MLSQRISTLFNTLGATNANIAAYAGLDPSNISRIKSGSRTPGPSSTTIKKMIYGIYIYADNSGTADLLAKTVMYNGTDFKNEYAEYILLWLYEGCAVKKKQEKKSRENMPYNTYGKKLNSVMNIADVSNVRISRQLHIDVSTVSRFRNGVRSPKSNPKLANEICAFLFERIVRLNRLDTLLLLIGAPKDASKEEQYEMFKSWLCDFTQSDNRSRIEQLLESISTFSGTTPPLPVFSDVVSDTVLSDTKALYYGTNGFQNAVIRFLANVAENDAKEVLLYSDQPMNWITDSTDFYFKWSLLMRECIKHGTRIRIIHNIDRDFSEMTDAINAWLPLYMSGLVESYYCKKTKDNRFTHTLFICPGHACISAAHISGCETHGVYRYDTDSTIIGILSREYKKLLENSNPLVVIDNREKIEKNVYCGKNVTVLSSGDKDMPFGNTDIVFSDKAVAVTRLSSPTITFSFSHPAMCEAFYAYYKYLKGI